MKNYINVSSYLSQFFSEWEILQTNVLEEIGTNFMYSLADSYRHFKYEFVYTFRQKTAVGSKYLWTFGTRLPKTINVSHRKALCMHNQKQNQLL